MRSALLIASVLAAHQPDGSKPFVGLADPVFIEGEALDAWLVHHLKQTLVFCPRHDERGKSFTGTALVTLSIAEEHFQQVTVTGAPQATAACIERALKDGPHAPTHESLEVEVPIAFEPHHGFDHVQVTAVPDSIVLGTTPKVEAQRFASRLHERLRQCAPEIMLSQRHPARARMTAHIDINKGARLKFTGVPRKPWAKCRELAQAELGSIARLPTHSGPWKLRIQFDLQPTSSTTGGLVFRNPTPLSGGGPP